MNPCCRDIYDHVTMFGGYTHFEDVGGELEILQESRECYCESPCFQTEMLTDTVSDRRQWRVTIFCSSVAYQTRGNTRTQACTDIKKENV